MAKFPVKKYATLEMNRARYLAQGNVVSQTPLAAEFTEEAPCENGMWVCANKANGEIRTLKAEGEMVGIVYTTEKEWGRYEYGLNKHADVAGAYPRVGIIDIGDTFTSNCFDMGDFNDVKAFEAAMKTLGTTPLYVVPQVGNGRPKVTAAVPTSGAYAQVVKYTTAPNGEKAIKYVVVRV